MTLTDPVNNAPERAGWPVQDRPIICLAAGSSVAVREFKIASGHGFPEYQHIVEGEAVGVLEAKPTAYGIDILERQADDSAPCLAAGLNPPISHLPLCPRVGVAPPLDHYEVQR